MTITCNYHGCKDEATFGYYAQVPGQPDWDREADRFTAVPPAWFRCRAHAGCGPAEPLPEGATTVLTSPKAAASFVFPERL